MIDGLHPNTAHLVAAFSEALADKLAAAEKKYGRTDDWTQDDWQAECQRKLITHVAKGDPLDVAAYAAFCWHHGWETSTGTFSYPPAFPGPSCPLWECGARKQGTAGGNDPADCNWPVCGCDPYADKVIAALDESGLLAAPSPS